MKKIIFTLSDQIWGGKHLYTLQLANGLRAFGFSVVLCVEKESLALKYAIDNNILTYTVSSFREISAEEQNALQFYIEIQKFDFVICTGTNDTPVVFKLVQKLLFKPVMIAFQHNASPSTDAKRQSLLYQRVDALIVVSQFQVNQQLRPWIEKQVLNFEKVFVLPSAVDLDQFYPRSPSRFLQESFGFSPEHKIISCNARLSWEKDHYTLLKAFNRAKRRHPEIQLLLVGEGTERGSIIRWASENRILDSVVLAGFRKDIADILSISHLNILSSNCNETGPLCLKEAMAMGVPVIASNKGAIPEFVQHEATGMLFEAENEIELAECITTLLEDPLLYNKIAINSLTLIKKKYSENVFVRSFKNILERFARCL